MLLTLTVSDTSTGTSALITCPTSNSFLILTKSDIHFFTPSIGIQADASIPKVNNETVKGKEKEIVLPLFSTVLQIKSKEFRDWSHYSRDYQTLVPTTYDGAHWKAAVWSPLNLSALGGCILATLSSNCEVILYEPPKNPHRGEWVQTFDLTAKLLSYLIPGGPPELANADHKALRTCQSSSLAWSSAVQKFGSHWSVLAVGNRQGGITFWRHDSEGEMALLYRYQSESRAFVDNLTWSEWSTSSVDCLATAQLAIAFTDGEIHLLEVTQDCNERKYGVIDPPKEEDDMEVDQLDRFRVSLIVAPLAVRDRRLVSEMRWISLAKQPLLVFTKLGTVNFVWFIINAEDGKFTVEKQSELDIVTVGKLEYSGATSMATCTGIEYLPTTNSLIISLACGSFHTILLDPVPTLSNESSPIPSSSKITTLARKSFVEVTLAQSKIPGKLEQRASNVINSKAGMKMLGMRGFGNAGRIAWIYEHVIPDQLEYRFQGKTNLILEDFIKSSESEELEQLKAVLSDPPNTLYVTPTKTLSNFLFYAINNTNNLYFMDSLIQILSEPLPPFESALAPPLATKLELQESVRLVLYGIRQLEILRLKECVARALLREPRLSAELYTRVLPLQEMLSRAINQVILIRLSALFTAAQHLSPSEVTVSNNLGIAAISLGTQTEGQATTPDSLLGTFLGTDNCEACEAGIPFSDIRRARCDNGHEWERCSITLATLSTTKLRTCIGCERKTITNFSESEGENEFHFVQELLTAVTCCLFCGGRWMKIR